MSDKNLEQIFVTENTPFVHPPNEQSAYDLQTDYLHLGNHTEDWELEVLANGSFVERWMAEKDDTIVQIIPYVICCTQDARILSYRRKGGGEGRLEGKRSIGIGGHVNIDDLSNLMSADASWDFILKGAVRELQEELTLKGSEETLMNKLTEIGIVYTPLDGKEDAEARTTNCIPPVGAVHLGDIYMMEVPEDITVKDGEGMIDPEFLTLPKAFKQRDEYETWSRLIIETLNEMKDFTDLGDEEDRD